MSVKKKAVGPFLMLVVVLLAGCRNRETKQENQKIEDTAIIQNPTTQATIMIQPVEPSVTVTPTRLKEEFWEEKQRKEIINQKPEYVKYKPYTYQLGNTYIVFYLAPDANKEDWTNYYGDIWTYDKNSVTQIEEKVYLVPDSLEVNAVDGYYAKGDASDLLYLKHGKMDEIKEVIFLDYSTQDHTITVQNIEWLTPWREDDKPRIQELIELNKIDEEIWDDEYYIFTEPEDIDVYRLADDVNIVLWEPVDVSQLKEQVDLWNVSSWKEYDCDKFKEVYNKLYLTTIYIKDNLVYLVHEMYTP